jgi:hypothetical protein
MTRSGRGTCWSQSSARGDGATPWNSSASPGSNASSDFVNDKIYDLLLRGVANAKANGRDIIEPHDLPITKGLQESIHAFKAIDEEVSLDAILEQLTRQPPLDATYSDETRDKLPQIAGGLGVALARTFPILDPDVKNPQSEHWDRATRIFDLLL